MFSYLWKLNLKLNEMDENFSIVSNNIKNEIFSFYLFLSLYKTISENIFFSFLIILMWKKVNWIHMLELLRFIIVSFLWIRQIILIRKSVIVRFIHFVKWKQMFAGNLWIFKISSIVLTLM